MIDELKGRFLGLPDSPQIIVGEIEKEKIFSRQQRDRTMGRNRSRGGRFFDAGAFGTRRGKGMFFEFRDIDRSAVIGNNELVLLQVGDWIALPIRDIDLDELKGNGDLVLKRLRNRLYCAFFNGVRMTGREGEKESATNHEKPDLPRLGQVSWHPISLE